MLFKAGRMLGGTLVISLFIQMQFTVNGHAASAARLYSVPRETGTAKST